LEVAAPSRGLRVVDVADQRPIPDKTVIGENREKPSTPIEVKAIGSVGEFATDALRKCLTAWGVRVDDKADLILKGEIASLFVREENRYNADLTVRFRLESSAGVLLWEGVVTGQASTFGKSLSPENYNQVLSDGFRVAYANLLSNRSLQDAWSARPQAATMTSAALKATVLRLMKEGVGVDVIAEYSKMHAPSSPLSAEDILDWKSSGIPDPVISGALSGGRPKS